MPTWTPTTTSRAKSPRGPALPASLATTGQPPLSSREGPYRFLRIAPPLHTHSAHSHTPPHYALGLAVPLPAVLLFSARALDLFICRG